MSRFTLPLLVVTLLVLGLPCSAAAESPPDRPTLPDPLDRAVDTPEIRPLGDAPEALVLRVVRDSGTFDAASIAAAPLDPAPSVGRHLAPDDTAPTLVRGTTARLTLPVPSADSAEATEAVGTELAIELLVAPARVRVLRLDRRGLATLELEASAERPAAWSADLGAPLGTGESLEIQVLEGEARAAVTPVSKVGEPVGDTGLFVASSSGGSGTYLPPVNWIGTGSLYYEISGAPPNTCGTLHVTRNGIAQSPAPNWVCTDGSGYALKGPWNHPGYDETASAYIVWTNGTDTSPAVHVWDAEPPEVTIDPLLGTPPTTFNGSATDPQWGAGFNANSVCEVTFYKVGSGYWVPGASGYTEPQGQAGCSLTWGANNHYAAWQAIYVPPASIHSPGCYTWTVEVSDHRTEGTSSGPQPFHFCI